MSGHKCSGLHCDGCRTGGGKGWGAVVALVLLLAVAVGRAVAHVVAEVAMVVMLVALSAAGLAVTAAVVVAVIWLRRRPLARPLALAARPVVTINPPTPVRPLAQHDPAELSGRVVRGLPGPGTYAQLPTSTDAHVGTVRPARPRHPRGQS
jgi:hypothetical protein